MKLCDCVCFQQFLLDSAEGQRLGKVHDCNKWLRASVVQAGAMFRELVLEK